MNPTQIQQILGLSAGSVNGILGELQTWGVIRRVRVANDRSFYYEVQAQIWKSIHNVLKARELRILEEAVGGLESLEHELDQKGTDTAKYRKERVKHVREAVGSAHSLGNLVLSMSPENVSKLSKVIGRLRSL